MNKAWEFLDKLGPDHVEWFLSNCVERRVEVGERLITVDEDPHALFIVLFGLFGIYPTAELEDQFAVSGAGELLGEISFLDAQPASATVAAIEPSMVLVLLLEPFKERLKERPEFAASVYHALGTVVAERLRRLTEKLAAKQTDDANVAGQEGNALAELAQPFKDLKATISSLDRKILRSKSDDEIEDVVATLNNGLQNVMIQINDAIGDQSKLTLATRERLGARIQQEMLPYLVLSENADRWYSKPRGYAGDFYMIELMYRNQPSGTGRVGPWIDECFLALPPPQATRNRRGLVVTEILAALERAQSEDRPARVTSLACGPARELFDAFEQMSDPTCLSATLVDLDQEALDFCEKKRDQRGLTNQMRLARENLIYVATRKSQFNLEPQDLVYSIGLIDYFGDQFVVNLINFVHDYLLPGGRLILGNFHPSNPGKALMDYVLEWRLIHRDEEDMNELFRKSKFGKPCSRILYEDQRINLFAECVK